MLSNVRSATAFFRRLFSCSSSDNIFVYKILDRVSGVRTAQHPTLTAHGFGVSIDPNRPCGELKKQNLLEQARQELLDAHLPFEYCCQWIDENPELPDKRTSYHWKHQVENWLRANHYNPDYIGEGVFTLAAIYKGYKIHRIQDSTGARIEP